MDANEARRLSELKLKDNKDFQDFVKFTEHEIVKAIDNGERKCVLVHNARLLETMIEHYKKLGYEIRTNIPPSINIYYLFW